MTSMPETKQLLRETRDRIAPPPDVLDGLQRRRRHNENKRRVAAAVVALVVALVGLSGWFVLERDRAPRPADRSEQLGIFAPIAGRIVYSMDVSNDAGRYAAGLWAVDPAGPSDTAPGPNVADDAVSSLVRLGDDATPLGWSRDGTELLLERPDPTPGSPGCDICAQQFLSILHADGSETRVNENPMSFAEYAAAISPDGKRVVYADDGVWVVDADGGRPIHLADEGNAPTFSPDGTQVAYLVGTDDQNQVWVVNVDGSDAHEILAEDARKLGAPTGMQWSPAGDRIALGAGASKGAEALAIYTFAPDGSNFTRVIAGGESPFWSPDGSRIAYTIRCVPNPDAGYCPEGSILRSQYDANPELFGGGAPGLAIADADGSNVREYGFAASGPWHPGDAVQPHETKPTADDSSARANGEVLRYTGQDQSFGDLVAVNPETGEERILMGNLSNVRSAEWSADGRWVVYSRSPMESAGGEIQLWVVGASGEPRLIATAGNGDLVADGSMGWVWSRTGARLLLARFSSLNGDIQTIERSRLQVIDFATGVETDLGSIDGYARRAPAWSPDETRLALAAGDGSAVYSVDLGRGERSLLVHIPEIDHDPAFSIDSIQWSPDGTHISFVKDLGDRGSRLYVMDADGSNLRLLTEGYELLIPAWPPDGTRLAFAEGFQAEGVIHILVAPMDGSDPVEIGTVPFVGCVYHYECGLTWSPDGSTIGFAKDQGDDAAFPADGSRAPEPIDDLTYLSWAGGRFGSH
jgi:Tol biopolymer transport system component